MEAAVVLNSNLPGSPDAFAFAKATIENIVRADVAFRPMAFKAVGIVTTFDEKTANVVIAITAHRTVRERKMKLHPMALTRAIVVETNPRPGGVKLGAHSNSVAATVARRQITAQKRNGIDRKTPGPLRTVRPRLAFVQVDDGL
jgi:hypothetical protein